MEQTTAFTIYVLIIISSIIGVLITINLLVYYCCIRPKKNELSSSNKKFKTKTGDKNNNNEKLLSNDETIININETNKNQLLTNQNLDSDVYKYLGISLSEIPFIDEDSKASSLVDLNWNPYKSLSY